MSNNKTVMEAERNSNKAGKATLVLSDRNAYGAMVSLMIRNGETPNDYRERTAGMQDAVTAGLALVAAAIRAGKIAAECCDFDRKGRGFARNYDVYDVSPTGGVAIVQERETTGTKYGMSPKKTYRILRRRGRGVTVEDCPMPGLVVKLAKGSTAIGQVIASVTGRAPTRTLLASPTAPQTVYKAVAVADDGSLRSIFDGTTLYAPGTVHEEPAKGGHGGGFYAYRTPEEARAASVPASSVLRAGPRRILRCVGSGVRRAYGNGKRSYSRLEVVEVLP